jgi:hypothetical protein
MIDPCTFSRSILRRSNNPKWFRGCWNGGVPCDGTLMTGLFLMIS